MENPNPENQTALQKPLLKDTKSATHCGSCRRKFHPFLWAYNCFGCGEVFCDDCARVWILLPPELGYPEPQRVCSACKVKYALVDFSKKVDVLEPPGADAKTGTILLVGGALGNRANQVETAEVLSKKYRVLNVDLPSQGGRLNEPLTRQTASAAIKEAIQLYAPSGKAMLIGFSMGGYACMQFAAENPDFVNGCVLHGCHNESFGFAASLMYGMMGAVYKTLPKSSLWSLIPKTFKKVPKDRMDRLMIRTAMEYEKWPECAHFLVEPSQGFTINLISQIQCPVLLIRGSEDFHQAEDKYMAVGKDIRKVVIEGGSHIVQLEEPGFQEWHDAVLKFASDIGL